MGEAVFNSFCRLCLRETFSLSNIFSSQSPSGELIYDVLNFVYDLKICPDDGLPPLICAPCSWKMHEFNSYKMNVHFAKEEIVKLLDEIRPDSVGDSSDSENVDSQLVSDSNPPVNVKEEIDIEEWQMPEELKRPMNTEGDGSESVLHAHGNIMNIHHEPASSEMTSQGIVIELKQEELIIEEEEAIQEADKVPVEEFQDNGNQQVVCHPLRGSSQLPEVPNSDFDDTAGRICLGESSSVNTAQENNVRIRHTNNGTSEKDLRGDVVQAQDSLSALEPKSFLNLTEPDPSLLKAPLSKMKNMFICDICKKGYHEKYYLGRHIRVHYHERLFSCGVCEKRFKQDAGRYRHELRHLKDTMSDEKSGKRSMKKPFSCGICGRNFGSKSGFIYHLNRHRKKYSCSKCGRSFGSSTHLKNHLRVHTKEKPFECQNCFKSFSIKINLTQHMVTHFLDKPFACDVCKKKFKTKRSKKHHELLHLRKK